MTSGLFLMKRGHVALENSPNNGKPDHVPHLDSGERYRRTWK